MVMLWCVYSVRWLKMHSHMEISKEDDYPSMAKSLHSLFGVDIWEGDATQHFSVKKGLLSDKGEAFSERGVLVRISTGKAIQRRGSGHSVNLRI